VPAALAGAADWSEQHEQQMRVGVVQPVSCRPACRTRADGDLEHRLSRYWRVAPGSTHDEVVPENLMTLPARQQRDLNAIDEVLRRADPKLATMFGVFTQLTAQDGMPAVETLPPGRRWARPARWAPGRRGRIANRLGPLVILPLLIMATLSVLILAIVTTPAAGQRRCSQVVALMGPVRQNTSSACAGTGGGHTTQPSKAHG